METALNNQSCDQLCDETAVAETKYKGMYWSTTIQLWIPMFSSLPISSRLCLEMYQIDNI